MAAKPSTTKQEDSRLLIYRLEQVEKKTDAVILKLDSQENIKKSDLIEFRDTIVTRVNEIRDGLQKQIDDKADLTTVNDIKTQIKAVSTVFGSIITGLVIYYLTRA